MVNSTLGDLNAGAVPLQRITFNELDIWTHGPSVGNCWQRGQELSASQAAAVLRNNNCKQAHTYIWNEWKPSS